MKTKLKVNPILKKELKVTSRSMRLCWELFAYEAVLAIIFLFAMLIINEEFSYGITGNNFGELVAFFPVIGVVQLCIVSIIIPIFTASAISGERERQTFDIMLTTSISTFSIVFGKVCSAVAKVMLFVVASIPIMALSFILGGLNWGTLFGFLVLVLIYAFFAGSIGILCSSFCKKSITAIILSYAFYFGIYGMTFTPAIWISIFSMATGSTAGNSLLLLLMNPIVLFVEFFFRAMSGESALNSIVGYGNTFGVIVSWLGHGLRWMIASCIVLIGLSALFMFFTAKNIDPIKGKQPSAKPHPNTQKKGKQSVQQFGTPMDSLNGANMQQMQMPQNPAGMQQQMMPQNPAGMQQQMMPQNPAGMQQPQVPYDPIAGNYPGEGSNI